MSAPNFHFLTGKTLDRLHDGAAVAFDAQLSLLVGSRPAPLQRSFERFVVSYDLWEEKYSVTRPRDPRTSASHLSAAAAEAMCIDGLRLSSFGIPPDTDLRLHLELRAEDAQELSSSLGDPGISLSGLIEIFSRPPRVQQKKWTLESGLFRVGDLKNGVRR